LRGYEHDGISREDLKPQIDATGLFDRRRTVIGTLKYTW